VTASVRFLTVLYDSRCALCLRAKTFLEREKKYVELRYVAAGSDEARQQFPGLDAGATLGELTVVSDAGAVWRGAKAFLMCLWALESTRGWALKLSEPDLQPLARRFFHWFSENRLTIGRLLPFRAEGL
jgi:predicted DCC family thiol-disulfide oxidoreductase YuxK